MIEMTTFQSSISLQSCSNQFHSGFVKVNCNALYQMCWRDSEGRSPLIKPLIREGVNGLQENDFCLLSKMTQQPIFQSHFNCLPWELQVAIKKGQTPKNLRAFVPLSAERRWLQLSEHRISFTRWPRTQNLLISLNTQPAPRARLSGLCLLPLRVAMAAAGPPRCCGQQQEPQPGIGAAAWQPRASGLRSAAVARPPLAAAINLPSLLHQQIPG